MPMQSINPTTGQPIKSYTAHSDQDVERALTRAEAAFQSHRLTSFHERRDKMIRTADIMEQEIDGLATLATQEMGKTFTAAKAEVKKCADCCRFYAENAERFLKDRSVKTEFKQSYTAYLPIGPVLAVMPWNFPYWQVFRFAAPALMAGNVGLLKHASNVPGSALAIEDIFTRAGFNNHEFQTLLIGSNKVETILKDHRVRAATLTGSEKAGAAVAAVCGSQIKKTVLELGGSDPFIVMPSADLDDAVEKAVMGRTVNNGQSCIAAKRFIIHQDIYSDFRDRFVARFEALTVGDPMKKDTDIGPLAMPQIRTDLETQVKDSIAKGAKKLCGAEVINGDGYFYRPGLLEDIPENSPAYSEEFFGPVGLLFKVKTLEQAITLGNATRFGLGSAIFTNDDAEKKQAVHNLDAGCTFINRIVASDQRLPFGGVKASGYGRELAEDGIREFVNAKSVIEA